MSVRIGYFVVSFTFYTCLDTNFRKNLRATSYFRAPECWHEAIAMPRTYRY